MLILSVFIGFLSMQPLFCRFAKITFFHPSSPPLTLKERSRIKVMPWLSWSRSTLSSLFYSNTCSCNITNLIFVQVAYKSPLPFLILSHSPKENRRGINHTCPCCYSTTISPEMPLFFNQEGIQKRGGNALFYSGWCTHFVPNTYLCELPIV